MVDGDGDLSLESSEVEVGDGDIRVEVGDPALVAGSNLAELREELWQEGRKSARSALGWS